MSILSNRLPKNRNEAQPDLTQQRKVKGREGEMPKFLTVLEIWVPKGFLGKNKAEGSGSLKPCGFHCDLGPV